MSALFFGLVAGSVYVASRMVERVDGVAIGMGGMIRRDSLPGPDIGYAMLPAY